MMTKIMDGIKRGRKCRQFFIALLAVACLLTFTMTGRTRAETAPAETVTEAVTPAEGMPVSAKTARVFNGTLDSALTMTVWDVAGQEDVPYVPLDEYLTVLHSDAFMPSLTFSWEGNVYVISRNGVSIRADLDGVFDDQDGYGGQYNFYIITSGSSYSCANALPYFAQKDHLAKVMGQKPGGGDCVVGYYVDAAGRVGAISGFLKLGTITDGAFVSNEDAVDPDLPMTDEEVSEVFFHPDKIAEYIANHAE